MYHSKSFCVRCTLAACLLLVFIIFLYPRVYSNMWFVVFFFLKKKEKKRAYTTRVLGAIFTSATKHNRPYYIAPRAIRSQYAKSRRVCYTLRVNSACVRAARLSRVHLRSDTIRVRSQQSPSIADCRSRSFGPRRHVNSRIKRTKNKSNIKYR